MRVKVNAKELPVGAFLSQEEEDRVGRKTFDVTGERTSPILGGKAYLLDDEKFPHVPAKYATIVEE